MSWADRTRRSRRRANADNGVETVSTQTTTESLPVPELPKTGNGNGHGTNGNGIHPDAEDPVVDAVLGLDPHRWDALEPEDHPNLPFNDGPDFRPMTIHEADVVAVVASDGRLVFVSASAEQLLGYDVSEAVGTDAFALFDPENRDEVRAVFADLVARRRLSVSLELRTRRADGYETRPRAAGRQPPGRPGRRCGGDAAATSRPASASNNASMRSTAARTPWSSRWPTAWS